MAIAAVDVVVKQPEAQSRVVKLDEGGVNVSPGASVASYATPTQLAAEASTRATADTTLNDSITTESSARQAADGALAGSLASEVSSRISADNTLQTNINSEAAARIAADNAEAVARAAAVSAEAAARVAAINAIPSPDYSTLLVLGPTSSARNVIQPSSGTYVPLTTQGASGQSANLFEAKNSSGTVLAKVSSVGLITAAGFATSGAIQSTSFGNSYIDLGTASVKVIGRTTISNVPLIVQGMASQSGDLQQWQDSAGTVLAKITSAGTIRSDSGAGIWAYILQNVTNTGPYLSTAASGWLLENRTTVGNVALTIKGMASQSGNLTEWLNSSGTQLAWVTPAGRVRGLELQSAGSTYTGYLQDNTALGPYFWMTGTSITLFNRTTVSNIPLIIKGMAGQTGDLLQVQDSSANVLNRIDKDGGMEILTAGKGIKLKSPDGLTTKTLTINNSGALVLT